MGKDPAEGGAIDLSKHMNALLCFIDSTLGHLKAKTKVSTVEAFVLVATFGRCFYFCDSIEGSPEAAWVCTKAVVVGTLDVREDA